MKYKHLVKILLFVLILQLCSISIVNAKKSKVEDEPIKLLIALDIMEKDEYTGIFWETVPVTRGRMAQILCKLYSVEPEKDAVAKFEDVSDGDRAYVETAVRNGYMLGYGEGKFGPDDIITMEQAIKVFVSLTGGNNVAKTFGGYPDGYIKLARRLGILDGITTNYKSDATQKDIANLLYNAMMSGGLDVTGITGDNVLYSVNENETLLTEKLDIYRYSGIVEEDDVTGLSSADGADMGKVCIGGAYYYDPENFTDELLGCSVVVYARVKNENDFGTIVYVEESTKNKVLILDGNEKEFDSISERKVNYYEGKKLKNIELNFAVDMIYNGKAIAFDEKYIDGEKEYIKFIDNDGKDGYDVVVIYDYKDYIIEKVSVNSEKITFKYGQNPISLEDAIIRYYGNKERPTIQSLTEDDVVSVAISENETDDKVYTIRIGKESITGVLEYIKANDETCFTISGEKVFVSDTYENLVNAGYIQEAKAGDSGKFLINAFGKVVSFDATRANVSVGYLVAWCKNEGYFGTDTFSVKIYTQEKKLETYVTDEKVKINNKNMYSSKIVNDSTYTSLLNKKQLVIYNQKDGVLKEIVFPKDGYDAQEFSVDAKANFRCVRTGVLSNKYLMNSNTIIFQVPNNSSTESEFDDETNYNVINSNSLSVERDYGLELYEVAENGIVGYIVLEYDANALGISSGTTSIVVKSVIESVDANNDANDVILGYDESGKEVEIWAINSDSLIDATLNRKPQAGDVIQYRTDSTGRVKRIVICHDVLNYDKYYTPTPYTTGEVNSNPQATKVFGRVHSINSGLMTVYCGDEYEEITPDKISECVSNTGSAIFKYHKNVGLFEKITFDEIFKGDRVFAAIDKSNRTRIVVVYE